MKYASLFLMLVAILASSLPVDAQITVTSASVSGTATLDQALSEANTVSGDTITFGFSSLSLSLPATEAISTGMTIDGGGNTVTLTSTDPLFSIDAPDNQAVSVAELNLAGGSGTAGTVGTSADGSSGYDNNSTGDGGPGGTGGAGGSGTDGGSGAAVVGGSVSFGDETISGGAGGNGGAGGSADGGQGGITATAEATDQGSNGGTGGVAGNGGDGGTGLSVSGGTVTLENGTGISGGNGGSGGSGGSGNGGDGGYNQNGGAGAGGIGGSGANGGAGGVGQAGLAISGGSVTAQSGATISGGTGGAGGAGGDADGGSGGEGGDPLLIGDGAAAGNTVGNGGNGGAGGTGVVLSNGTLVLQSGSSILGGTGGNGGAGGASYGGEGGQGDNMLGNGPFGSNGAGGNGGAGLTVSEGGVTLTLDGTITGGNGGSSGVNDLFGPASPMAAGGNGGDGVDVALTDSLPENQTVPVTLNVGGAITGGNAGQNSASGLGGVGINLTSTAGTVVVSGSVTGGLDYAGNQADAIDFAGSNNELEIMTGASISGNVVVEDPGSSNALVLGGTGTSTFNVAAIGTQYQGFDTYSENGGTWVLTGTPGAATSWTIGGGGIMEISNSASLGTGGVILSGGELLVTSSGSVSQNITLNVSEESTVMEFDGHPVTVQVIVPDILAAATGTSAIFNDTVSGSGELTIGDASDTGSVTLNATNGYSGGTEIAYGTAIADASNSLGTGNIAVESGANLKIFSTQDSSGQLVNLGTVIGNGTLEGGMAFENSGTVSVENSDVLDPNPTFNLENIGGVTNESAGTFSVGNGATLNLESGATNQGLIQLSGSTALVEGGQIANSGTISGQGTISNSIDNDGVIELSNTSGSQQSLDVTGGVTNESDGTILASGAALVDLGDLFGNSGKITAEDGGTVEVTNSLLYTLSFLNQGTIDLAGGTFQTGTEVRLTNSGTIEGYGTLVSNEWTNSGTVDFTGGTTTVNGAATQSSGMMDIYDSTTFNSGFTITGGTVTSHTSSVTIEGTLAVNGGTYNNDPGTTQANNIQVGAKGTLIGGTGALYQVSSNVSNSSAAGFQLAPATLELTSGGNNQHTFTWTVNSGTIDIGNFTLDSGQQVDFENGGNTSAALHLGSLQFVDAEGDSTSSEVASQIDADFSGDLTIYYNPTNTANSYLDDQNYSFGDGGELIAAAVPEPSTWMLVLVSLLAVGYGVRRSQSANWAGQPYSEQRRRRDSTLLICRDL